MTTKVTRDDGPILELVDVVKRYGAGATEVRALTNVSITVERGEFVALMGPSGSGKSTLLHLAGGLERPSAGQVLVEGADLDAEDAAGLAALRPAEGRLRVPAPQPGAHPHRGRERDVAVGARRGLAEAGPSGGDRSAATGGGRRPPRPVP